MPLHCSVRQLILIAGAGDEERTFEGHRDSPEVRSAIDIPLGMARRLGCKRAVAIMLVIGMAVVVVAPVANVCVRVLLLSQEAAKAIHPLADLLADLLKEASEAHGRKMVGTLALERKNGDGDGRRGCGLRLPQPVAAGQLGNSKEGVRGMEGQGGMNRGRHRAATGDNRNAGEIIGAREEPEAAHAISLAKSIPWQACCMGALPVQLPLIQLAAGDCRLPFRGYISVHERSNWTIGTRQPHSESSPWIM